MKSILFLLISALVALVAPLPLRELLQVSTLDAGSSAASISSQSALALQTVIRQQSSMQAASSTALPTMAYTSIANPTLSIWVQSSDITALVKSKPSSPTFDTKSSAKAKASPILSSTRILQTSSARSHMNMKSQISYAPTATASPSQMSSAPVSRPTACFPAIDSALAIPSMPATKSKLATWWCDQSTEYAFMGFSYDVTGCPSLAQLNADFANMKYTYKARYVRLYGACDPTYDTMQDIVEAAAAQGLGIYSLVWFGFDGDDKWKTRLSDLIRLIKRNPKAPYVIRNIAIGSEPLFDQVLPEQQLARLITQTKRSLASYGMQVSLSDMPYGYQSNGNAPDVFKAIDIIEVNALPFFDSDATTGAAAWGSMSWDISYMQQYGGSSKPLRLTQTGWPSNTDVWAANSPSAVASIASEKAYFDLLDSRCTFFRGKAIGWFAHIYDDATLPGWGVVANGQPKFAFQPRTFC